MTGRGRTPLLGGERMQIALYRGALSTLKDLEGIQEVEGEFLHLQPQGGAVEACRFTGPELEKAMTRLPAMLEIIGNGIEMGVFFAKTSGRIYGSAQCHYCDYRRICGKDRTSREERKSNDPAVRDHQRLRAIDDADQGES
jgi:hypothetical protein